MRMNPILGHSNLWESEDYLSIIGNFFEGAAIESTNTVESAFRRKISDMN